MEDLFEGTLFSSYQGFKVVFITRKGRNSESPVKTEHLHKSLLNKKIDPHGLSVELELYNGQPRKVRPKGISWDQENNTGNLDAAQPQQRRNQHQQQNRQTQPTPGNQRADFHNPYNFVPAPPRDLDDKLKDHDLGDYDPTQKGMGHGCYTDDRWSGRITVKLTTVTPLLIPDAANSKDKNGHKTFPIRVGIDGKPYLAPTSIKGMLRSAYEAITNSRFGVFENHNERLFYRMSANDGLSLVPARIENGQVRLLMGTTEIIPTLNSNNSKWEIPGKLMYAAWLPRYRHHHNLSFTGMRHGDRVRVWLEQYQKTNRSGEIQFKYWLVREIVPYTRELGRRPLPSKGHGAHSPVSKQSIIPADGYVCITNKNIERKHDERVFFHKTDSSVNHSESFEEFKADWKYLIENYQEIHNGEERGDGLIWSRHVILPETKNLTEGTLCYAFVSGTPGNYKIERLYPVMISRAIYAKAPSKLLPIELKPARSIDMLSPADRVFGWVNQDGSGAYKGNLRISNVVCGNPDSIEPFGENGFPLAILGKPKPEQTRFYTASDKNGEPLPDRANKEEGYKSDVKGLRGRKVYPHHNGLPKNHWNAPNEDRTQIANKGHYQEYRRPIFDGKDKDDQNRSITAWVKTKTDFTFTIDITNLSDCELGALIWLLTLPENHYHRLGGGKPLGFGSVRLDIVWNNTALCKGEEWQKYYQSLTSSLTLNKQEVEKTIEQFMNAFKDIYGGEKSFDEIPLIQAFCQSARGFEDKLPIHYPRARQKGQNVGVPPHPDGKIFKWFVANERTGRNAGPKKSLLPLWNEDGNGLPLLDDE